VVKRSRCRLTPLVFHSILAPHSTPLRGGCYTRCVRELIVNADDFGLTAGVNRAIAETHAQGVVTSTTLMASGGAFVDAVQRARTLPGISVGCHVVLVDGHPVSAPQSIDTLVAIRSGEPGRFHSRLSSVAARAVFGGFDPDQLVEEITAQIQRIQSAGLTVTHLDTHKHTHIFPEILAAVVRAARICRVPAIRNPFVPAEALGAASFRQRPGLWKRYGQVRVLRGFSASFQHRMRRAGLRTPDGVVGVVETGSFDSSLLRQALAHLPDGTWELVCHPGYDDKDLRVANTRLRKSREEERRLLISAELRTFLEEQRLHLIGYREFGDRRS
jgi:hopanoid biosynthesis associated protein HpnK